MTADLLLLLILGEVLKYHHINTLIIPCSAVTFKNSIFSVDIKAIPVHSSSWNVDVILDQFSGLRVKCNFWSPSLVYGMMVYIDYIGSNKKSWPKYHSKDRESTNETFPGGDVTLSLTIFPKYLAFPDLKELVDNGRILHIKLQRIKIKAYGLPKIEGGERIPLGAGDNYDIELKVSRYKRQEEFLANLKLNYIGQSEAIRTVFSTIWKKEDGWIREETPLVLLFLGPSGVGKTELAKYVAKYLHESDKRVLHRLDMSEYQESHTVSKLIGSPPGYVNHDSPGMLTDKLKKDPQSIILLDEIEKAHSDVLTVFLQLFDEGRLTDGRGTTVVCPGAMFIMTTNIASEIITKYFELAIKDSKYPDSIEISEDIKEDKVYPLLKAAFQRNEFLGRITNHIYFLPFTKEQVLEIVDLELKYWQKKAKNINNISLEWGQDVSRYLSGYYNKHYGARSIKNAVDNIVVNKISELFRQGKIFQSSSVTIGVKYINEEDRYKTELTFNLQSD